MRGLGSGISNTISTMMPLVLYKVAGLVRIQRLRSEGYELTRCHASPTVLKRPSDLNLCMRASPAASYSPSGTSVEIIPDISDPNPLITQAALVTDELYTSIRDGHRPPADAAREGSERSHINPCVRRSPGSSCCTSGNIVESIPKNPVSSHVASWELRAVM